MTDKISKFGIGYDVHAFDQDAVNVTHITLGGIQIPFEQKLKGHSDADVALHAITDAILGAIGAGDIGEHFPPSDPQWKGKDSAHFLKHAAHLAAGKGATIAHIDMTIVCERPKIGPHKDEIKARISEILSMDSVSVKATTTEGLGFTGRREGIACYAIASILM